MIYVTDLQNLVSQWLSRSTDHSYPSPYRDAISECICDLNTLLENHFREEIESHEAYEESLADTWLSSLESLEEVA